MWARIFNALSEPRRRIALHLLDSSIVRAISRSRGGLSSKIPVIVGASGDARQFVLSAGQVSDKAVWISRCSPAFPRRGTPVAEPES